MKVETVFLDAGGVLVHPNWRVVAEIVSLHGLRADPARLEAAELVAGRELDTPEHFRSSNDSSRWFTYLRLVFERAGALTTDDALRAALEALRARHDADNLWESVPAEVPGALDRLRATGRKLVVVSNANGTVKRKLARVGIAPKVHFILDSHEEGVEKPDPRLFHIALQRSGARAETTIHVGDLYHVDVVGARAAGLRAVLFDKAGLHGDRDCPRVASLEALVDALETGRL